MQADLTPHPLRARILSEVHARPFTPVETPRRMLHYAFMTTEEEAARDRVAITEFCASLGLEGPAATAKHHRVGFSGTLLRWESHSEFTTYTWEFATETGTDAPPVHAFHPPPDALAGVMRLVPQPGPLLVAVDLHLVPVESVPEGPQRIFDPVSLAAVEVMDGNALVASDFRTDAHGYVRILVVDRGLDPAQAGGLTQRLLEIETYRTLALLGLPEAQSLSPSIRRIELELPRLMQEMRNTEGLEANHRLLDQLTAMAAKLEGDAAASLFRFGATRAYAELVSLRLGAIGETPVPGLTSWTAFLDRRVQPALRTCVSTEERQANLSRKLARAAQLLRTRVEIELQSHNRTLLSAMNERARVQLRLQQTVEGLSVAAITYYVASLVHHVLEGAHTAGVHVDPTIGTAAAIPVILVVLALVVRRIRRHHAE